MIEAEMVGDAASSDDSTFPSESAKSDCEAGITHEEINSLTNSPPFTAKLIGSHQPVSEMASTGFSAISHGQDTFFDKQKTGVD